MRLLGTGRLADSVGELLPDSGVVIVAGDPKLAVALAGRGLDVAIAGDPRAAAKVGLRAVVEPEERSAAGAVVARAADEKSAPVLAELVRAVVSGGVVVLLDKGARTRASEVALLAGLSRLTQFVVSRTVVTAGVVEAERR